MANHEHKSTRVTLERVTVTTFRRRRTEPIYCELCRCEIEAGAGRAIDRNKTKLLTTGEEQLNTEEKQR